MEGKRRLKAWHERMPSQGIFWCRRCVLPLLGRRCGICGMPGCFIPLSPPGDIRPAMREGRALVDRLLRRDFGIGLPPGILLFNKLSGLDRRDQLIFNGYIIGTLAFDPVSRQHGLRLTAAGASMLIKAGAAHLVIAERHARSHIKGKVLPFSEFSGPCGGELKGIPQSGDGGGSPEPLPGRQSYLWEGTGEVLIAGRALAAVGELRPDRGGVRIRDACAPGPSFSGRAATIEEAVRANLSELRKLEAAAVREIRSAVSERRGLPLAVSFSGGKDSLAALVLAVTALKSFDDREDSTGVDNRRESHTPSDGIGGGENKTARVEGGSMGRRPVIIFSNTGIEFPETVEYVRGIARKLGLPLLEKDAGDAFWENLPRFGIPAKDFRWCCKVCKLAPMSALLSEYFPAGVLTVEGRRRRESFARQRIGLVEESPFVPRQVNLEPIRDWRSLDVWLYNTWKGLPHNPLYDEDLERVGCWMCPSSLEAELEVLRRLHPELHARWSAALEVESKRRGWDARAVRAGAWRWRVPPPKILELARAKGWTLPGMAGGEASLEVSEGPQPCASGGHSLEAVIKMPAPTPMDRIANLLNTVGEVRWSGELGVAMVRRGVASARFFESGHLSVNAPDPTKARKFLRHVVGALLRSSRCSACGVCERGCPRKAIRVGDFPVVDLRRCTHCMKCAAGCVVVHYAERLIHGRGLP
ncbi:MAG: phosphoadenosine phosphosulfate reductase family protein [Thermoplasmata archaeon]